MTDSVTPLTATDPASPEAVADAARATATDRTSISGAFGSDRDLFLKLLVAQLRYQDPTNPAKPQEFMAQTAQFTMVDNLMQISQSLADAAVTDRIGAAASLVGKTVAWDGGTGTVTSVQFASGQLQVTLDTGTVVPADALTEIAQPAAAVPPGPDVEPPPVDAQPDAVADGSAADTAPPPPPSPEAARGEPDAVPTDPPAPADPLAAAVIAYQQT